jgi:hypothetical protein
MLVEKVIANGLKSFVNAETLLMRVVAGYIFINFYTQSRGLAPAPLPIPDKKYESWTQYTLRKLS